jgi:hypothetical protein
MGLLYKSGLSITGKGNSGKPLVVLNESAEKEIEMYLGRHPKLRGFIFDTPQGVPRTEAAILSGLIVGAVSAIGIGIRLRSKKTLVLAPSSLDQELVAHRICANFQTVNSYSFSMRLGDNIKALLNNY